MTLLYMSIIRSLECDNNSDIYVCNNRQRGATSAVVFRAIIISLELTAIIIISMSRAYNNN